MENDLDKKYARTYAKVNLSSIRHNIMEAKRNSKPGTKIMAIVKANAYGHGAIQVSNALTDLVDAYGVAVPEEALTLREAGIQKMILILGYSPGAWREELIANQISLTVYDLEMARNMDEIAKRLGKKARVHIKLDTGMGRIGFQPNQASIEVVEQISHLSNVEIEGMFTHFARADEECIEPAKKPYLKYIAFRDKLAERKIEIPICHVCNSAAIIGFPEANLDMVRSGITTYGIYPSNKVSRNVEYLERALEWKSEVSFVKNIQAGTPISYGGTFVSTKDMKVATIPVGYADGMKRDLSNRGRVLIHGEYAPILGRICMDQFMVDVTEVPNVKIGSEVTIIGKDGSKEITVEEISELAHSFSYEFLCSISERVPRKYVE